MKIRNVMMISSFVFVAAGCAQDYRYHDYNQNYPASPGYEYGPVYGYPQPGFDRERREFRSPAAVPGVYPQFRYYNGGHVNPGAGHENFGDRHDNPGGGHEGGREHWQNNAGERGPQAGHEAQIHQPQPVPRMDTAPQNPMQPPMQHQNQLPPPAHGFGEHAQGAGRQPRGPREPNR